MPKYKKAVQTKVMKDGKPHMETRLEDVEFPTDRFILTAPRYMGGSYIAASMDAPAVVTLAPGSKVDDGLVPEEQAPGPPKPHYAEKAPHPHGAVSAASAQGAKVSIQPEAPEDKGGKHKRPSDKDAL